MAAGARSCGDAWRDLYLAFPIWRFLRIEAPPARRAWVGLLAPGADRVGRLFPVVVAMPLSPREADVEPFDRIDARLVRIEDALLDLLEDDDVDRFERCLLQPPEAASVAEGGAASCLADSIARSWMRDGPAPTLTFWHVPASGVRSILTHRGRPDPSLFLRLVGASGADADGR
jgi:type VI secretion system ImpM family protein